MESAGFQDIVADCIPTTLHNASAADACGAAFAAGPVALAYSRFDTTMRVEAEADYLASIEAYRTGETYDVPGEFVVARGINAA